SAFLSEPVIHLPQGTFKAELTEASVRDLTTLGSARVEIVSAKEHISVYLTTRQAAQAACSSAAGVVSSAGSSRIMSIEDYRSRIFEVEPPAQEPFLPNFQFAIYMPFR